MQNRRGVLKMLGGVGISLAFSSTSSMGEVNASGEINSTAPGEIPTSSKPEQEQVQNRAPLTPNAFYMLPLGAVRPTGWLRSQLRIQADGLSGHLDETWPDVGKNSGWLGGNGEAWERGPYFVDGLLPLAVLLDDPRLKKKALRFVEWTLTHQAVSGMIGPATNDDWWPRMVMLKVLTQYYELSHDQRVLVCLSRYFDHQLRELPNRPLRDWGKFRWQDNALVALWLYNRTGEPRLLDLVRLLHKQGFDWQANYADFKYKQPVTPEAIKLNEDKGLGDTALATHGVNNGQALKAAPVWSMLTGQESDRVGLKHMLATLDEYHGLPNGMFSCDEHFAGRNPSQGSELCTVVESMYSLEQSLAILGDATLGDRLEQLAFNALPGTFTDNMWAHQYNQEPNQVEVSLHRRPWTTDGPESNLYGLEPNFGCCTANFHQGWPKFAASLWMSSHEGGVVAAAYGPCDVQTVVDSTAVRLTETTEYPFRGQVRIAVHPAKALQFPLQLRIPGWAQGTKLRVNGELLEDPVSGTFVRLTRVWNEGDVIELNFPLEPRITTGFNKSVSIHRGPLLFSYPIQTNWVKLRPRGLTADWQVFPASPWNYALQLSTSGHAPIKATEHAMSDMPFTLAQPPVTLTVSAKQLWAWRAIDGVAEPVPVSPVTSDEAAEAITLVPYAAAKLRISAFPVLLIE